MSNQIAPLDASAEDAGPQDEEGREAAGDEGQADPELQARGEFQSQDELQARDQLRPQDELEVKIEFKAGDAPQAKDDPISQEELQTRDELLNHRESQGKAKVGVEDRLPAKYERPQRTSSISTSRVWWGDMLPRLDGTQRVRPRQSDYEFYSGRGQWENKAEFVLSCMGMSVGLGNVWRFPYLAYKNGGAAFLIAYIILQLLVGYAMYFMEVGMSQFSGKGPTKLFDMFPAAKGVGIAMCMVSTNIAIYYNVIMGYTVYYFFASMQTTLPWTVCQDDWVNCVEKRFADCTVGWEAEAGKCTCTGNATIDQAVPVKCVEKVENATTAAELYFYKSVIQRSQGLEPENIGTPIPSLALCLLFSWTVVVFCLIKGIKSSGKVVYFSVTFPYFILFALLIRGFLLDGAGNGVKYFLIPDWSKLQDINVWASAGGQMFFSLSVTLGGIIMFGSYNRFSYPVYSGALLVASMDLLTSIIGGLVVFSTFGAMAKSIGSTVDKVAKSGYGLAFVVYPEALSRLPPTHVWSAVFFFMLFTLGLDSEFGLCETVLTCIHDEIPRMRAKKSIICVVMGIVGYLLALPCICPGGDYVVTLMDSYGADFAVLILAFCEVVAMMWGYGATSVLRDLEYMLGSKPHAWQYWAFCWTIACPIILATLFMNRIIDYDPPQYASGEAFPQFAQNIGWFICTYTLCPVPLWFFYLLYQSYRMPNIVSWKQRKQVLFSPNRNWIPNDGRATMF
ncbi:transporter [Elysia marginata]|uniref:Transporter n=1 Tax=Elysia marginata TaxID=1093978 RepID=A0AAV4I3Y4_9GAST|nr:transporter [Elysia marginata]